MNNKVACITGGNISSIKELNKELEVLETGMLLTYDSKGALVVQTTSMSRESGLWLLMEALDYIRKVER